MNNYNYLNLVPPIHTVRVTNSMNIEGQDQGDISRTEKWNELDQTFH